MNDTNENTVSPGSRPSIGRRRSSNNKDMTLEEIQKELKELTTQAHQGIQINEKRFDYLLRKQLTNKDYQQVIEEEKELWRESVTEFSQHCLERTRSFIPVNIFHSSQEDLMNLGLNSELAKRILQRQCLWLVRMAKVEIARLHESDLIGRFNSLAQQLDIIETAAIYASIPETFYGDATGRKQAWRDAIEDNLRQMLLDNDRNCLSDARRRHPLYDGNQFGPVEDITSVRENKITTSKQNSGRRSFIEVCQKNSIISKLREKPSCDMNKPNEEDIIHEDEEQEEDYEEDDGISDSDDDGSGSYYEEEDEENEEEYNEEQGEQYGEEEEYDCEEDDDNNDEGDDDDERLTDVRDTLYGENVITHINEDDNVFSDDEYDEDNSDSENDEDEHSQEEEELVVAVQAKHDEEVVGVTEDNNDNEEEEGEGEELECHDENQEVTKEVVEGDNNEVVAAFDNEVNEEEEQDDDEKLVVEQLDNITIVC